MDYEVRRMKSMNFSTATHSDILQFGVGSRGAALGDRSAPNGPAETRTYCVGSEFAADRGVIGAKDNSQETPLRDNLPRLNTGYTLLELLTAIAVIAILAVILLPVTSRVRESARRSHCANNLREIGTSFQLYANDHNDRLPAMDEEQGGLWPWDVTVNVLDALIRVGGGERDMFFCRSGSYEDRFELWDFAVTDTAGDEFAKEGFRVIRYVLLLEHTPSIYPRYTNTHLRDPVRVLVSEGRQPEYELVSASQRELAVDATLSIDGRDGNFHAIPGGSRFPDSSNHLEGTAPAGGNILFLDGHVAWRDFADMDDEKFEPNPPHPTFWW